MNFTSFLDNNSILFSNKKAMIDPKKGESITYSLLLKKVNSLAYELKKIGIEKGDRILVITGSKPETIISYFAIWRIGAICIPVNPNYKKEELSKIIENSEPKLVITWDDYDLPLKSISVKDIPVSDVYISPENVSIDDICQIQYTSGTTGNPKGVMISHGNWMASVEAERWALDLNENDIYLGFYPHFHSGVTWGITSLRYGATFIVMERYNLMDYLNYAKEYKATILSGMPPIFYDLLNINAEDYFDSVRCIITGGAPLSEEIWRKFSEKYPKIRVVNAYGLTETLVLGSGTVVPYNYQYLSKGYRSVGIPVTYTRVKIVDSENPDKELQKGEIGEIAISGPGVAKGYWRNKEETEKTFRNGWLLTGDLGYLDEDNVLYITSRKKDVIIMSGWKIYPLEVEEVLMKHPKIAEVAVFAMYDKKRGEIPAAAVVLKPNVSANSEEIIEFCKDKLASYKIPKHIIFLKELPKMNNWKILRRVLREKYGGFPS